MQPDPGPVVIIGLKEIYDAVTELKAQMALLVTQHAEQSKDLADHENRLRHLEETQSSRRLSRLEDTVEALKAARWPLPSAALLLSLAALLLTAFGDKL